MSAVPGAAGAAGERWTAPRVRALKGKGRIAVLTAYDFPTAKLDDGSSVEIVLVGDSLGMVVLGYETTLPVTVADMVHHTRAVVRARPRALVVAVRPRRSVTLLSITAFAPPGPVASYGLSATKPMLGAVRSTVQPYTIMLGP